MVETVVVISVVIGMAVVVGLVVFTSGVEIGIILMDVASNVGDTTDSLSPIVPPARVAADCTGVNVGADETLPVVVNGSIADMDVDA